MAAQFKSVFTVTWTQADAADLDSAVSVCQELDAHLSVLVVERALPAVSYQYGTANAIRTGEDYAHGLGAVEKRAEEVRSRLDSTNLSVDVACAYVMAGEVDSTVAEQARCADLSIFPAQSAGGASIKSHALHGALFKSGGPVLIVPPDTVTFPNVKTALIAWDGGVPAARAVRDAIAVLQHAQKVHLVVVGDDMYPSGICAQMVSYLARHGIAVEEQEVPKQGRQISAVLLDVIKKNQSDLLVMGAYGHSRLRERLFGGTTRNMIDQTTVPILMSH